MARPVTHVHDIIRTASCNTCHDQLSAHGGSRRGMNMCVLCHTPQNTDPNTGDTMDAKVFFHKIHMGASLPSVKAGTPYVPANNQLRDFRLFGSGLSGGSRRSAALRDLPFANHRRHPGDRISDQSDSRRLRRLPRQCQFRHRRQSPGRHTGRRQPMCSTCHIPQGEIDFDASILGAHVAPTASSLLSGLAVNITKVQNGTAGSAPVVTFTVLNNAGAGIPLSAAGFHFVHHGRTHHRLRIHQFRQRRHNARLCDRKRRQGHLRRQRQLHVHLHAYGPGGSDRHLCDRRRSAAHRNRARPGTPSAAEHSVRSPQQSCVLFGGWLAGGGQANRGADRQLQSMPCFAAAARYAPQQHRVLRDVP